MIEGRYFAAGASGSSPAKLWGSPGDLRMQVEGENVVREVVHVHLSDRLGNVPRKLTFDDGGVFEAPAEADIDGLMGTHASFFSRLSRLETNWRFVAFAFVVTLIALVGIYRYGIPLAASGAAAVTPSIILETMDHGTRETVDRTFFDESELDDARRAEIQRMFDELAELSGQESPALKLLFRDGGRLGANAFALPGGTIVLTDQLVEKAESDDEIAGVIAHEIGHVQGRHSLKQIYRVLGLFFMIGLIGGDSSQIIDDVVGQAAALQTLSYSREFETDADRRSVELMVRAGRDPVAFVHLLERLGGSKRDKEQDKSATSNAGEEESSRKSGTSWISTHPATEDRREAVEQLARELGWEG